MAYYKNLIAIHEQNDPREILRMINPRETEMMDAAAGGVYHHELESLYAVSYTHLTLPTILLV